MVLSRFIQDRKGSILPLFALTIVPLIGVVGAAIDYSRANALKASLQAALDSTALAMSNEASTVSTAQLQTDARSYFLAVLNAPQAHNVAVTTSYTAPAAGSSMGGGSDDEHVSTAPTGAQVVLTASASLNTAFLGFVGVPQVTVAASATSIWSERRLRVALALDNTGSMSSAGKMTALKTATHNLLATLQNAAQQDGDVYVSIIPFSKDVNVGASNYNQTWLNFTAWNTANGSCNNHNYTTQSSCTSHGHTWTAKNHNTWNGCVTDRDQNYDEQNTTPTTNNASTLFPAEQYTSCPAAMMGQSQDWTALNTLVDSMTPDGNTNQAIGLVWAWQSLTAGMPLNAPAKDPNYQYEDIVILLTDGLNTQNRWTSSQSAIDTRQQKTCDNIKAANVTIYAVQVNTDGDPTSTLLQNCASDASKFFLLTSASQIITTFGTIGGNLAKLHLAK